MGNNMLHNYEPLKWKTLQVTSLKVFAVVDTEKTQNTQRDGVKNELLHA